MSHVLIGGRQHPDWRIEDLLGSWGMTLGPVPGDGRPRGLARVHECDALVWICADTAEADGVVATVCAGGPQLAPVLLLGAAPTDAAAGGPGCRWLGEPGPRGALLRAALQACLGDARSRRGGPAAEPAAADQLHFLGHELRSPLTAVKTALEVLHGDLGRAPAAAGGTAEAEGSRRMLEIALRNVRRLHQAVEWSHGMMLMAEAPPCPELQATALSELGRELQALHPGCRIETAADGAEVRVHCDSGLVAFLAAQAARAVEYAAGGGTVWATLALDDPRTLRLTLAAGTTPANAAPVERTRLVDARPEPAADPRQDLLRLARLLIPAALLDSLGAELETVGDGALALSLPVGQDAPPADGRDLTVSLAGGA